MVRLTKPTVLERIEAKEIKRALAEKRAEKRRISKKNKPPKWLLEKKRKKKAERTKKEDVIWLNGQSKKLKPTGSEVEFAKKLSEIGYEYTQQYVQYVNGFAAIYDFFLEDLNVFVEIDGGVHYTYDQYKKDKVKDSISLNEIGVPVVRFTNSEAIRMTPDQIGARLRTEILTFLE